MRKTIMFLVFNIVFFQLAFGQSVAEDAFLLRKYVKQVAGITAFSANADDKIQIKKILLHHLKKISISSQIDSVLRKNIFISKYLPAGQFLSEQKGEQITAQPAILTSLIGGLDITNIADGFAKFLVERTKEELATAFFEKFKNAISDSSYKEIQILFPQTYATLNAIGDQIYNYSAYMNALRESFEKDLNSLLTQLPLVIEQDNSRIGKYFQSHPDLKAVCLSSIYIGNGLLTKQHPGQIIANYDTSLLNDVNLAYPGIIGSVQTLQLFSESIRSQGTDHYWMGVDSLRLLFNDTVTRDIYFGLIYEKGENIVFGRNDSLRTILRKGYGLSQDLSQFVNYIIGFGKQAALVTDNIKNLEAKNGTKSTFLDYYNCYNSALDLIEYASNAYTLPGLDALKPANNFMRYMTILRTGGNIALDINRRNYSSAIINSFLIYNFEFPSDNKTDSDKTVIKNAEKVKSFILNYGSFIAAMVQAQNSYDVKSAIEAAALPAGSYRIKRESCFDVALNAYVGFFAGYDAIKGYDAPLFGNSTKVNSTGITAPIGISTSTSWGGCSFSLFLSVIDLGAVAAFRFADDSTKQVPTIRLKDIFAPGAFVSFGIPSIPISLNLGIQIGPNLHAVNSTQNDYTDALYWRLSLSVCVDIPIFSLYTK